MAVVSLAAVHILHKVANRTQGSDRGQGGNMDNTAAVQKIQCAKDQFHLAVMDIQDMDVAELGEWLALAEESSHWWEQ